MKRITVDGNEACALASYLFTEYARIDTVSTPGYFTKKN